MAIKVKLLKKTISGNRKSLYLDFYPAILHPEKGKPTRREFLKMYLFDKPKNFIDKQHNNETVQIAEQIRQKRENQINKPEIYTGYEKEQLEIKERGEQNFVEYFKILTDKRKATNYDNWASAYKYLEAFTKGNLRFADLNEKFCNEFKEYLLTTKSNKSIKVNLAQNSAGSYFSKLKAALKQAYKDGYLFSDLDAKINCIKTKDTIKQTLTIEELNKLAKAECKHPLLKKFVLFSALTGIPYKEMQNLNWSQVETSVTFGYRVKMRRQKSKRGYYINISKQAYNLMGEQKEQTDKVFEGINDNYRYKYFQKWLVEVGIQKKMTFHDLRHTYGSLQIDSGTDIYTLQGNMGHSTIQQTMKYGKISDPRKRKAADNIQLDL